MTQYIKRGNQITVCPTGTATTFLKLDPRNYVVKFDPNTGYFLEEMENFTPHRGKVYDSFDSRLERIITTFQDREKSTGVLLTGDAGSGKTMLSRAISMRGYDLGLPTLIINDEHCGDNFNKFIADIEQPTVVIFDEYEKIYDSDAQNAMLTLFDGVYTQKKLFIITCNDPYKINSHMISRPGRMYYSFDYGALSSETVRAYLADNLKDQSQVEKTAMLIDGVYTTMSFDSLRALCEEMNRYGEPATDVLKSLNIKAKSSVANYEYIATIESMTPGILGKTREHTLKTNPMVVGNRRNGDEISGFYINAYEDQSTFDEGDMESYYIILKPDDLVSMNRDTGVMKFRSRSSCGKSVFDISVIRKEVTGFDLFSAFK